MVEITEITSNGTFSYVLIPADTCCAVEEKQGSTSGGLTSDELIKKAKEYFSIQHNAILKSVYAIDDASEEDRKMLLDNIREQIKAKNKDTSNNSDQSSIDDDSLLKMYKSACEATTCEILALTYPTKENNFEGVSMYISPNSNTSSSSLPVNARATALMRACKYNEGASDRQVDDNTLHGDVFVGRYHDNEMEDIWIRTEFTADDASTQSEWCQIAATSALKRGGGNAPALMNMSSTTKKEEKETTEENYKWTQNDEELEIKLLLDADTKTKDIKINFSKKKILVKLSNNVLLNATTAADYIIDESTFTVQDVSIVDEEGIKKPQRELCIILAKKDCNAAWWEYAIKDI